jgi:predicted phosphodiesterase
VRVAVLADIHGNLPALDAVLRDVGRAGADLIVLNGDIADGPMPDRTLERLAGLGDRAVWVQGNDHEIIDPRPPSAGENAQVGRA